MSILSLVLSLTAGRVLLRFKTLGQWAEIYRKIIDGKPIEPKTKENRLCSLGHILDGLGEHATISSIRPHDVAGFIQCVYKTHPALSKRLLIEIKDCLNEAVNYGWINRSPAAQLKAPKVKVQRKRLTLEQWLAIHATAVEQMPPWVPRMLTLALVTGQRRSDLVNMRFADVWDGHLHIEQVKTGTKLALPLALKLDALGMTLKQAIDSCRDYAVGTEYLLRKHNGQRPVDASLSARFEEAREMALPAVEDGHPTSLHECRSLSERLYSTQGIDTMTLLGHKHQRMTEMYHDDRGLTKGDWKTLTLSPA